MNVTFPPTGHRESMVSGMVITMLFVPAVFTKAIAFSMSVATSVSEAASLTERSVHPLRRVPFWLPSSWNAEPVNTA